MKKYLLLLLPFVLAACHVDKDDSQISQENQYISDNHCQKSGSTRYPTGEIVSFYKCDNNGKMYVSNLSVDDDDSIYARGKKPNDASGDIATGYLIGRSSGIK